MATSVGGVQIEIRGDDSHFERTMREVRREAGRTGQTMAREFRTAGNEAAVLGTKIRGAATSMLALTAALGAGAGLASGIRTLADFGQAMSTLQAVTGATADEIKLLEAEAKRLGGSTRFSASQAAEGMIFLARAGFTAAEALQAVEGTLTLAQAGGLDLGRAADIASNVLGGFNLNVDQTARVVDVLAKAANSANVTVEGLGEALKFAAPTAAALGLSLEETVAIIGKLGDSGLQGGLGGRGFQSFATAFVGKKDEITAIIGEFDLASEGLNNLIRRLVAAGITTEQVINIFRAENLDVFTILANASQDAAKGTEVLTDKLNDAGGTAARVAATMDDNLNGAILGALSAFEALILAIGEAGANAALTSTFKGLADLLRFAAKNADILGVAIVALSARAVIPLAISAVPAAIGALRTLAGSLLFVQGAAARTTAVLSLFGGPLTLAIAGAAAAYVAFARSNIDAAEAVGRVTESLNKYQKAQDDIAADTLLLTEAQESLTAAIEGQGDAAVATATLEVDAIRRRIAKNQELAKTYESLAKSQLAQARAATAQAERGLARNLDVQLTGGLAGPQSGEVLQRQISQYVEWAARAQDAGYQLNEFERGLLEQISTLNDYQLQVAGAEEAIAALGQAASVATTTTTKTTTDPDPVVSSLEDQLASQLAILSAIERRQALDVAIASGNEELVQILEDQAAVEERRLDYLAAGYSLTEAIKRSEQDISAIIAARQRGALLDDVDSLLDELGGQAGNPNQKLFEDFDSLMDELGEDVAVREAIANQIAAGLEQGIRSGNWGDAFRDVLASATTEALGKAIDDLAGALLNLFSSSGGNFGGVGSIFGAVGDFLGNRAGGGPVRAGMRYMVGEQGPEMFVPSVPGMIVPKFEGPASAAAGGVPGVQSLSISAPLIVQGSITEDVLPRVQAMMAAQARELPRVIDARVADSIRRNRY